MKELAIYQLEVAFCITAFSGFYLLFWRKETNFLFKRFLLIGIPLLSLFIPLLDFNITLAKEQPVLEYMAYIPNQIISQSTEFLLPPNDNVMLSDEAISQAPATINIWQIIFISWILVAFFMLLRLAISFWKIWKISQDADNSTDGNYKLVNDAIQSFSFFNLIVINKSQAGSSAKEHILAHEQAHSRQGHSFDVLLMEVIKVIQWFNPFIWIITHDCKQNLEFLADQAATTSSEDKEPYQYAIVHHAANSGYQLLKTQFSKTNLKSRIVMMNHPNNRMIPMGKLVVLLPLLGALLMSFSIKVENLDIKKELAEVLPLFNPEFINDSKGIGFSSIQKIQFRGNFTDKMSEIFHSLDTVPDEVFAIVENQPRHATGMASYFEMLKEDLNYPAEAKAKNIKGKVFVEFIVQKDGTLRDVYAVKGLGYGCDEEAVRVISEGPTWIPGTQRGQAVDVRMIIPIGFGVDYPPKDMIDVRKISGTVKTENGDPVIGCNVIIKGTKTGTVSDGNGKYLIEVQPEHSALVFSFVGMQTEILDIKEETNFDIILKVDPEYKGSSDRQNTPGKVVVGHPVSAEDNRIIIRSSQSLNGEQPLVILDGKEILQEGMKAIDPNDIESISVLKDKSAVAVYGDKGAHGVILITSKSGNKWKRKLAPVYTDVTIYDDNNKEGLKLKTDGNLNFDQENPLIYFKDGVEITKKEVERIDPHTIDSIEVIKGKAAKEKYGKKGKNGVVLIKMKE